MTFPQFPPNFLFGAAAAFQIEGSPSANGKGKSIWDVFSHTPGKIRTGESTLTMPRSSAQSKTAAGTGACDF